MAMENLIIKRGLWVDFNAIEKKDPNTIYFITDKGRIYIGDMEFSRPTECVSDLVFITNENSELKTITKQSE